MFDLCGKRIWVAGSSGLVGSALERRLRTEPCVIVEKPERRIDLRRQADAEEWVEHSQPDAIIMAAAKVGGISANSKFPAEFIYDNLAIEINLLEAARRFGVAKVMLLGSSCIYPRLSNQPIKEEALLSGPLEPTNEWYAIAKIAGIKMCQAYRRQYGCDFISAMPTNLYGPNDKFDPEESHVIPALMRRMHEAKVLGASTVLVWGTGNPRREFLYVDDLADACIHLMKNYSGEDHINVGTGTDLSISELAELLSDIIGFQGSVVFDRSRPDGTPQKRLDVSKLQRLGWRPLVELRDGLLRTYEWFTKNNPPL